MNRPPSGKAAFVDRDGVINEERSFVHRAEDFVFIPGALAGLHLLQQSGFELVIITNQSGIARGLFTQAQYLRLRDYMRGQLAAAGVRVLAINHCPHLPDAPLAAYRQDCDCRKPAPGLITRALSEFALDPAASILIGDRASDVAAGRAGSIGRCYLVRSGRPVGAQDVASADGVFADLHACAVAVTSEMPAR